MVRMTRRVGFSSALIRWFPERSLAENQAILGPEASPEPTGRNFVLDVGVEGEINPQTGMVLNIKIIDRIVRKQVVQRLDGKLINRQMERFYACPVTTELLLGHITEALLPEFPSEVRLSNLRLEETPTRWVEWEAPQKDAGTKEPQTVFLTHVYEFAASHRLHSLALSDEENREVFGKCNYANGHGHNYILEVTVAGSVDPRSGQLIAPDLLDAIVNREVVDRYDHRHFNHDIPEFEGRIPSAEVISQVIWERLRDKLPAPVRLHRVLLRETARNIFEYRGEDETIS